MTFEELKAKYPAYPVKQGPVPGCPQCKGTGETARPSPCLCVCLSEPDPAIRKTAVLALRETARRIHDELMK